MKHETPVKRPAECRILIVDDEKNVCALLRDTLGDRYPSVDICYTARDAFACLERQGYDIVVTDLRLPDVSGMEVLRLAKQKDEFTEVIVITGFASLESASEAINLGVTSYLSKPLSITEFLAQIDRAAGNRIFHLKSLEMFGASRSVAPEVREHLYDVTNLYYFSRKLMLALEVPEIMRTVLEEANERLGAAWCAIGINFLDFQEVYAMPRFGAMDPPAAAEALLKHWSGVFDIVQKTKFEKGGVPVVTFHGRKGEAGPAVSSSCFALPMTILGRTIGFLAVCGAGDGVLPQRQYYLHVFASLVSSIVEHGYRDAQAKLQARTDSLTGIANHRMFHETLEREISRNNRHKRTFCLALIDIDDFKRINDTHGHPVGDGVLIDVSRRTAAQNRRGDVLARYGGEEFALILPDTDIAGGSVLAQRVCQAVAGNPFVVGQLSISYTVSIGLAQYDGASPRSKDALIREADAALYLSKKNGKNRVSVA